MFDRATGKVRHCRFNFVGENFVPEATGGNCPHCFLVGQDRECILLFAGYLPLLGNIFGRDTHAVSDGDVFVIVKHVLVHRNFVAHHRYHRHAFRARRDYDIVVAGTNAVRCHADRLHAGGTETVDRHGRHRIRQTRQQYANARHVHALLALGHCAADNDIANVARIESRHVRDHALQNMREHVVRADIFEHAARGFADRRADGGDDVGFLNLLGHFVSPMLH